MRLSFRFIAILFCLIILPGTAISAPTDFDGDGISDIATVQVDEGNLRWTFRDALGLDQLLDNQFGRLGAHLMPGKYSSGNESQAARVNDDGKWFIRSGTDVTKVEFGEEAATYMGGADIDGDGIDDLLYHNNRCKTKKTVLSARTRAFSGTAVDHQVEGGKGVWMSFYSDANGDGKDDFCWLKNNGKPRRPKKRFTLYCVDVISGNRLARSSVGTAYMTPLPLKRPGASDLLAFPRVRRQQVEFRLLNTAGKTLVKNVRFSGNGTLLVGNFTNQTGSAEQIGLHLNNTLELYDTATKSRTVLPAPEGIAVDEINVNSFDPALENCLCTSKKVSKSGRCTGLGIANCAESRELSDGGGNWLHKPVSDNTGSIVNLFRPSDRPQDCRYERADGSLFQEAIYTGDSNPNRPTWRPRNGGSCREFPKPLIVSCMVKGEKHCWRIPDPCQRYD